jgi:hypothetical protein
MGSMNMSIHGLFSELALEKSKTACWSSTFPESKLSKFPAILLQPVLVLEKVIAPMRNK